MQTSHTFSTSDSLNRIEQSREAVLLLFCDPVPAQCARLKLLSMKQWKQLLFWLDTSGLALYFLDRLTELKLLEMIPAVVLARLRQNLADSKLRIGAMIQESLAIQENFQLEGVPYATLKGFSLWPISVPKLELRSQLDLDFLIAESSTARARRVLEDRGYYLHAISGKTWEFKANQDGKYTLDDLYKPTPQRSVELHVEPEGLGSDSLLARAERRYFHGVSISVLPPVDLFLGQGLHLYKHVCGEFWRAAHLIEFRRHILARQNDDVFWRELQEQAEADPAISLSLGVVIFLASQVMGEFAPEALTCWTVDRLPAGTRLWVELYGARSVFANPPGSKLYLLLQREMQRANVRPRRAVMQALLPRRLPLAITHGTPGETMSERSLRYRKQAYFVMTRLKFHVLEGLRYLTESVRWAHYRQHS
jgi:hypothetical protein